MLDFLIVLGRVPGTNFVITFNELLAAFFVLSVRYEYRLHERWLRWLWYRTCVNYRKQKRHWRSVIKHERYRLAVFERRIKRQIRTYLRRRKNAMVHAVVMAKRRSVRRAYRQRRAFVFAIYNFFRRFKRGIRLTIRRRQKAIYQVIYRRQSGIRRSYYSQVIALQRAERRLKRRLA
jgi:hypothetical protein